MEKKKPFSMPILPIMEDYIDKMLAEVRGKFFIKNNEI